jgi:subtilase family serine protease
LSRGRRVSSVFALPPYQEGLQVKAQGATQGLPMRGVPDTIVIGGTGAVAPLWAGFIARINATMARRARFINPILYSLDSPSSFHRDELRIYLKDVRGEWNISNSSR